MIGENYRGMINLFISFVVSFVFNLNAVLYGNAQIVGALASVIYIFSWLYWAMVCESRKEKLFLFIWQTLASLCSIAIILFWGKSNIGSYLFVPSIIFLTSLAGLQYFSFAVPLMQIMLSLFLLVITFSRTAREKAGQI